MCYSYLPERCSLRVWPESRRLPEDPSRWSCWRSFLGLGVSEWPCSGPAASCPQAGGWWRSGHRRWTCVEKGYSLINPITLNLNKIKRVLCFFLYISESSDTPCRDDVRKLGCVGSDLYCDWLKEHELLADTDGVGPCRHVLQAEWSIFLANDCEEKITTSTHVKACATVCCCCLCDCNFSFSYLWSDCWGTR